MITPKFSCTQNETSVIVTLYVPAVRASEVEVHIDGTLFSVHINPYFLRLTFPANVLEDDDSSANYDPSTGYLVVTLTKETIGGHFQDLDLLAKLLAPSSTVVSGTGRGVEVIGDQSTSSGDPQQDGEDDLVHMMERLTLDRLKEREILLEAAKNDWRFPPQPEEASEKLSTTIQKPYGFLDGYQGYFKHVSHSENEVILSELGGDAEVLSVEERKRRRLRHEDKKWDAEYYMGDFVNDDEIQGLIQWKSRLKPSDSHSVIEFTEEENLDMLRLPRKEYLINPQQSRSLYMTLISILFAYAYDRRTTQEEATPESAWTICSLIPCFSALDASISISLQETLIASYRRALSFPLYRNWKLCERCRQDVGDILQGGRRSVTKALIRLKGILEKHDTYYVFGKIWVEDLIVWTQSVATDENMVMLAPLVSTLPISKGSIGWDLQELEDATTNVEGDSDDEDEAEVAQYLQPTLL